MCGRFNEGVEIEPVSDFLAPPTPLFPLPAHSASSGHAHSARAQQACFHGDRLRGKAKSVRFCDILCAS